MQGVPTEKQVLRANVKTPAVTRASSGGCVGCKPRKANDKDPCHLNCCLCTLHFSSTSAPGQMGFVHSQSHTSSHIYLYKALHTPISPEIKKKFVSTHSFLRFRLSRTRLYVSNPRVAPLVPESFFHLIRVSLRRVERAFSQDHGRPRCETFTTSLGRS